MSYNRDSQPTNEQLLTPKKEHWERPTRNSFKLTIEVQCQGMDELLIMKTQKQIEDMLVDKFKDRGANIKYDLA